MTTQLSPVGRFDKVLLATDGSEFSAGAEREAINLSRVCESQLEAMTVVIANPEYDAFAPQLIEKSEKDAEARLETVKNKASEGSVNCEILVRHSENPYQEIVETAEERKADVIVMGRRGKTGFMRAMMGGSTAKVVGLAHCAVLIVPKAAPAIEGKNILLAVDGSRYSEIAATATANLAKRLNAPVTILSVVYTDHQTQREEEAQEVVQRIGEFLKQEGVQQIETKITRGKHADMIVDTAVQGNSDLIVVGSHGRTGLERILMGSVSERIIGLTQCAVLVVKA